MRAVFALLRTPVVPVSSGRSHECERCTHECARHVAAAMICDAAKLTHYLMSRTCHCSNDGIITLWCSAITCSVAALDNIVAYVRSLKR
jgi:hypothetical protein